MKAVPRHLLLRFLVLVAIVVTGFAVMRFTPIAHYLTVERLSALLTQLRQKSPAALKLIALLDRPSMRTVDLVSDYHAFKVDDGSFVGYGLELDGSHANLPYIARL